MGFLVCLALTLLEPWHPPPFCPIWVVKIEPGPVTWTRHEDGKLVWKMEGVWHLSRHLEGSEETWAFFGLLYQIPIPPGFEHQSSSFGRDKNIIEWSVEAKEE